MRIKTIFRITIILSYLIIVILIASMIYPIPAHQIEIKELGNYYGYINGNLTAGTYLNINNRGPYPINDFTMHYDLYNSTIKVSSDTTNFGDIAGNKTLNVSFRINVNELLIKPELVYLIFHSTNLTLSLKVNGGYAYGLVKFFFNTNVTIAWERLAAFNITGHYVTNNSTDIFVHFPFYFGSAPFLHGNITLISKMVLNGTVIGIFNKTIPLGTNYTSEIIFKFPISEMNYLQSNVKFIKVSFSARINNSTVDLGVIQ
ncbi:MAG: hypothetical protein ACP5G5_03385 [Thermoplasmata archaeon]|nr:hypothetical protein [Thermoplasmatales archaeon]PMP75401.1 MAG: hypothetical protein C0180_01475 [Aciduliprofundum sp.]